MHEETPHILVVDDDTRLSAMLADYLSGNGFQVRTAATAGAGVAEVQRGAPDAVILDVMLPDFDGFEACRRIRAVSVAASLTLALSACSAAPSTPAAAQEARPDPLPGTKLSIDQLKAQMFHVSAGKRLKPA